MKVFPMSIWITLIILLLSISYVNADFNSDFTSLLNNNNPDEALLLLAQKYPDSSDTLEFINEYITNNSEQFGAYGIRGWILNDMNNYIDSLGDLDKGVKLSGHDIQFMQFFLAGRAQALYGLGQKTEALTRADQAIDNQEMNFFGGNLSLSEAYTIKGLVHFDMSEYTPALDAFRNASNLDPGDPNLWYNIGNCYYQLNDASKALDAYNTSISIQPSIDTYYYKALTLSRLSQYDEAIKALKEALKIDPDNENILEAISDTQSKAEGNKKP